MGFTFEEFPSADFYKSDLRKILKYVRSISDYLNELDSIIKELQEGLKRLDQIEIDISYLKQRVIELQAEVDDIKSEIADIQSDVTDLFVITSDLTNRVVILETKVEGIYEYIDAEIARVLAIHYEDFYLLTYKLNQAKAQLQEEIDELRERLDQIDTNVYNPWIGERVTQQENVDFTYNHLADECLTAAEYCTLGYTAEQYAALDITSRDYQEFGKTKTRFNWVFSPVYGFRQEVNNVLTSIVNFVCNTLSADEYATLDITAEEYANMELSSEQYFRYNPNQSTGYIEVNPMGIGLTVDQYSHLQTV